MAPPPGSIIPSASETSAMVEAVPITMQVPGPGASRSPISSISASLTLPARCIAQNRRQSVQAPSRSPRQLPVIIGPVTSRIAGRSTLAAAMSSAGTVLSQPPISTTESIGCARIISSASIAIRLRRNIEVGCEKDSWIEMIGNGIGQAACEHDAALDRLDHVGNVPVAGVVAGGGVGDADDRPVERLVGVAHRLDEGFAEKEREAGVAIVGEALPHAGRLFWHYLNDERSP